MKHIIRFSPIISKKENSNMSIISNTSIEAGSTGAAAGTADYATDFLSLPQYELVKHEYLADINSDCYLMKHRKSGARVVLIPNNDNNKVFYIAFRTPPKDSTGVAHIIEHTVLCGSRKFPVKDPFVELAKGSLNTFLNAMTYPDKTVYPVASCNDRDFCNLMNVYLDAVFYPQIYSERRIFEQEGWHYEAESREKGISINGVVYNEMKGVMSSPDDVLEGAIMNSLFPHNTYAFESGGDPEDIPKLTYEDYLGFHSRYYHPSNSYIYLFGNVNYSERLVYLDDQYLSKYDQLAIDSAVSIEPDFAEPVASSKDYSIMQDEDPAGKTYLSWNVAFPDGKDEKLNTAFRVIDYVLCDAEGGPVKKALLEKGIGRDVSSQYESGVAQPVWSVIAKYADADQNAEFEKTIDETLENIVRNGFDADALAAGINYHEFRYREADFGSYPKGLVFGLNALDSWLYDDADPWSRLRDGDIYKDLKDRIGTGYFEQLVRKYLIQNKHRSEIMLCPKKGLTAERDNELRKTLDAYAASLTDDEFDNIVMETERLREYQETPDSEENIKKIPLLGRKDLRKKPVQFKNTVRSLGKIGGTLLVHPVFTGKIAYISLLFDIRNIPEKYYRILPLIKTSFASLGTSRYDYAALNNQINILTGGISCGITNYTSVNDPDEYKLIFDVSMKVLHPNLEKAFELLEEIVLRTNWHDIAHLKDVVAEEYSAMRADLPSSGHVTAVMRAGSYFFEQQKVSDDLNGIGAYQCIDEINSKLKDSGNKAATVGEAAISRAADSAATSGAADSAATSGAADGTVTPGSYEDELCNLLDECSKWIFTKSHCIIADVTDEKEGVTEAEPFIRKFIKCLPKEPAAADTTAAAASSDSSATGASDSAAAVASDLSATGASDSAAAVASDLSAAGASAALDMAAADGTPPDDLRPYSAGPVKKNEGLETAGQVQYVCRAGNFRRHGYKYTGALRVLKVIMNLDYLWNRLRVKGGAYGCMSLFNNDGCSFFVSFRDPHLKESVEVYEQAADFVRSFDVAERKMTQFVIGAVSALDSPLTPAQTGRFALGCYMTGKTYEMLQTERREILTCEPGDIRALGDYIDAFMSDDNICVVGSTEQIENNKDLFMNVGKLL